MYLHALNLKKHAFFDISIEIYGMKSKTNKFLIHICSQFAKRYNRTEQNMQKCAGFSVLKYLVDAFILVIALKSNF